MDRAVTKCKLSENTSEVSIENQQFQAKEKCPLKKQM